MQQLTTLVEMREAVEKFRQEGKQIGFVPTMGALHEGHLHLIRASVSQNDITICSIFVNQAQFNNAEDFRLYPRLETEDAVMLESAGCNLLFLPSAEMMYPFAPKTRFSFGELETVMEGAHRPGHFNGVALVVSKLFNIVQPHRAYFGQKDLQQYAIIKQLVTDLNINLDLVRYPIVRENDGLAMSSRNRRLTPEQRELAPELHRALKLAQDMLPRYEISQVKHAVENYLSDFSEIRLEYFEIVDSQTLQPVTSMDEPMEIALCLAAFLGDVRLIDNIIATLPGKE